MVQRTKRSLHPQTAAEMQKELRAFHWRVRTWCGEVPIGETVYVSLEGLNSALIIADGQLQAAVDNRRYEWPAGRNGL